ncbi:unnamed protein product [Dovyalis caffra]|uniref:Uncharacterized protein n=1 Tax=Dovyalis caffra TaxID=77055 RepID=A0AAV1SHV5_9ROSI|nr:unnamed protein product [Dovyalis caffra]
MPISPFTFGEASSSPSGLDYPPPPASRGTTPSPPPSTSGASAALARNVQFDPMSSKATVGSGSGIQLEAKPKPSLGRMLNVDRMLLLILDRTHKSSLDGLDGPHTGTIHQRDITKGSDGLATCNETGVDMATMVIELNSYPMGLRMAPKGRPLEAKPQC